MMPTCKPYDSIKSLFYHDRLFPTIFILPSKARLQQRIRGMAGFSHFGSEWGKTVSKPTLLIVIIVKKDWLCAAQVNSFISGNALLTTYKFDPAHKYQGNYIWAIANP